MFWALGAQASNSLAWLSTRNKMQGSISRLSTATSIRHAGTDRFFAVFFFFVLLPQPQLLSRQSVGDMSWRWYFWYRSKHAKTFEFDKPVKMCEAVFYGSPVIDSAVFVFQSCPLIGSSRIGRVAQFCHAKRVWDHGFTSFGCMSSWVWEPAEALFLANEAKDQLGAK